MTLKLIEDKHIYVLGDEELPSVSHLCRFLYREVYKDAPAWQMEQAAIRGTAIHEATQQLDIEKTAAIDFEYLPYLEAYKRFLTEHSVKWEMIEKPFYHPTERYAGTIDRYGKVDGFNCLADIKSSYTVHKPLCRAQLNLYRLMLIARGFTVDKMLIIHLKKDGTYKIVHFEADDPLAYALLKLHETVKKRKRKRS